MHTSQCIFNSLISSHLSNGRYWNFYFTYSFMVQIIYLQFDIFGFFTFQTGYLWIKTLLTNCKHTDIHCNDKNGKISWSRSSCSIFSSLASIFKVILSSYWSDKKNVTDEPMSRFVFRNAWIDAKISEYTV